ncbi:hypothetical protein D5086_010055 [Populus alba]|uniref:Uncharacterized protein n=1 Tax=Populus alba TaxID=43335 RepID=A0ACC4C9M1_POPAL
MDPGKKRHNELRYKQELRRDIVLETGFPCCIVFCSSFTLFKTLAISFSTMTLFTRIAPPYVSSLLYAEPDLWAVVYLWAAHLVGLRWGHLHHGAVLGLRPQG